MTSGMKNRKSITMRLSCACQTVVVRDGRKCTNLAVGLSADEVLPWCDERQFDQVERGRIGVFVRGTNHPDGLIRKVGQIFGWRIFNDLARIENHSVTS